MTFITPVRTELNTGGTTEEMMQSRMSVGLVSKRERTFLMSTPYWSEVLMWSVATRASKTIFPSRMPPMTMFVLPISMARSIFIHLHWGSAVNFPLLPSRPGQNTAGQRRVCPNSCADIIQELEVLCKRNMKSLLSFCKREGRTAGLPPLYTGRKNRYNGADINGRARRTAPGREGLPLC